MTVTRTERWSASVGGYPYEPYLVDGADVPRLAAEFRTAGLVVLGPPALDPGVHEALAAEAEVQRATAAWTLDGESARGELDQHTVRAHLGPLTRTLLASSATRALLYALTGEPVLPGWSATCLTCYDEPGAFLGAHRDKERECRYALLLYLTVGHPAQGPGPGLALHVRTPDDSRVAVRVTARPNRAVVLHGSRLTHYRPPLAAGERLVLLSACFEAAG